RDGGAHGLGDVGVRRLVEADVAIADLHEEQIAAPGRPLAEQRRAWDAAAERPDHPGARPGHALEEAAAIDVGALGIVGGCVVPCDLCVLCGLYHGMSEAMEVTVTVCLQVQTFARPDLFHRRRRHPFYSRPLPTACAMSVCEMTPTNRP